MPYHRGTAALALCLVPALSSASELRITLRATVDSMCFTTIGAMHSRNGNTHTDVIATCNLPRFTLDPSWIDTDATILSVSSEETTVTAESGSIIVDIDAPGSYHLTVVTAGEETGPDRVDIDLI